MPLNFEPQLGSAVDLKTGLTICAPRMLPASLPENPDHTEYQYSFRLDGNWFYGLGLFGTDEVVKKEDVREWVFMLDLGRDWVLDTVFDFKRMLSNNDDDFIFLQGLAQGLIRVFEKDINHDYNFRYIALTDENLLAHRGIVVPDGIKRLPSGDVVLAEVFVPVHYNGSDA